MYVIQKEQNVRKYILTLLRRSIFNNILTKFNDYYLLKLWNAFSPDSQSNIKCCLQSPAVLVGRRMGKPTNYQETPSATAEPDTQRDRGRDLPPLTSTAYKHGRPWVPQKQVLRKTWVCRWFMKEVSSRASLQGSKGSNIRKHTKPSKAQFQVKSWPRPNPTGVLACKLHWQVCAALKRESSHYSCSSVTGCWFPGKALNSGVCFRSIWMT